MKKRRILSIVLILAALALAIFIPVGASAAFDGEDVGAADISYYGRGTLAAMEEGEAYVYAYDKIVECVEECGESAAISNGKYTLSGDEVKMIFDVYRRDHVEHFWLGNGYQYSPTSIKPTYIMTGDELSAARAAFDSEVDKILSCIAVGTSEFDIELYLHDLLAKRIVYTEAENAHNSYGAIVEGKAVCEGYAEALGYLLQRAGITAFMITGESVNASTGLPEGHEWCAVKIDGAFYHVDLTWDDQGETIYYAYFNLSDEMIATDHTAEPTAYPLPVCNSMAKNYFTVKGGAFSDGAYTVDNIASLLNEGNLTARVYINGSTEAFTSWYGENIKQIAGKCNVKGGFRYGTRHLGNECIVSIIPDHVHAPTLVEAKEATCTERGNIKHYLCTCGKMFNNENAQVELTEEQVYYAALGHLYMDVLIDDAHKRSEGSCQEKWSYWYSCTRCGANAKDDSEAQDKFFYIEKIGEHVFAPDFTTVDGRHYKPCTVEGCSEKSEEAACSGGTASCTSLAKCSICKKEYGVLTAHTFDMTSFAYKGEDGHAHKCTNPYCLEIDAVKPHTPGDEATESTAQVCLDCNYIIKAALGHTTHTPRDVWEYDADGHFKRCSGCEEVVVEKAPHTYEGCEEKCVECDYRREHSHVLGEWQKNDDEHWRTCPCGELTERAEHVDEDGNKGCDVCNRILTKSAYADIPALAGIRSFLEKLGIIKLLNPIKEKLDDVLLGAGFSPSSAATLSVTIIIGAGALAVFVLLIILWIALRIWIRSRRRKRD